MKIAFIISNLYGGGAERAEINIMNALSEKHDVTAICYRNCDPDRNYPLAPGVRLVYLKPRYPVESHLAVLDWFARLEQIRHLRKRERFDAVVSFLDGANAYNIMTARDGKTVISIRNLISKSGRHRTSKDISPKHALVASVARRFQNCADAIICVSEDVAQDQMILFHVASEKVSVIHNFVDPAMVQSMAQEENRDPAFLGFVESHDILFGNCGRLVFQKGQWHLLKAFSQAVKEYPHAGLFIIGEGKLEPYLKEMISGYGLSEHVMLCGYQTNPIKYMKYADWLVHSALYEGMSNSVLEAMALGLPVICTDCAGTRELLTPQRAYGKTVETMMMGEYGIVCRLDKDVDDLFSLSQTESEKYLAAAMLQVMENPALKTKYREASTLRVKEFSKEKKIAEWEQKISALVSGE